MAKFYKGGIRAWETEIFNHIRAIEGHLDTISQLLPQESDRYIKLYQQLQAERAAHRKTKNKLRALTPDNTKDILDALDA